MVDFAKLSTAAIVAGLTAILLMALAAVLFASGNDSLTRTAPFFALAGLAVTTLTSMLRADQTKTQTNGVTTDAMQAAINAAVEAAHAKATGDMTTPEG